MASIESVSDAFAHESEPLPLRLAQAALILVVSLTLNLAGNARTGLWDRDEPRYATCTREMRQGGDWIHPTFNGEPRYDKPILIYWLMLVGTAIGGDNPCPPCSEAIWKTVRMLIGLSRSRASAMYL